MESTDIIDAKGYIMLKPEQLISDIDIMAKVTTILSATVIIAPNRKNCMRPQPTAIHRLKAQKAHYRSFFFLAY